MHYQSTGLGLVARFHDDVPKRAEHQGSDDNDEEPARPFTGLATFGSAVC